MAADRGVGFGSRGARAAGGPAHYREAVTRPRTLTDDLRDRSDEELAELLAQRPDLTAPVPGDLAALAARAASHASTVRALDGLDQRVLTVLEAVTLLPAPASVTALAELLGAPAATVSSAVDRLRRIALLWGSDDDLQLPAVIRDLARFPAGLGPPVADALLGVGAGRLAPLLAAWGLPAEPDPLRGLARVAAYLADPGALRDLLVELPADERQVLDALNSGVPVGLLNGAAGPIRLDPRDPPARRLLGRGLLVGRPDDTVVLPREVGLALRGGRPFPDLDLSPPEPGTEPVRARSVGSTAGGAATRFVALVGQLLEAWGDQPPPELRSGGLGVRELRRTAALLDLTEPEVALVLETAYAAGLLAPGSDPEAGWLPTPAYDRWRAGAPAQRWVVLAEAWLTMPRLPGLVGSRDDRDRPFPALSRDLDRPAAPTLRAAVLRLLGEVPTGRRATPTGVAALLSWRAPRGAGPERDLAVGSMLTEAEELGLTGLGALAEPGRLLAAGDPAAAAVALRPLLPAPLDHVLLQADLTAVAPGPLEPELAAALGAVASVESTGGATVYRFTETSVRRGLDAGYSAADISDLLRTRSRTPVPQPLSYLVEDVARRHGRIRVGTASAYLRCDDEALLAEVLASRRTTALRLRRLAPTVLAAVAATPQVLAVLRAAGFAPVQESLEGEVVLTRPARRRAADRAAPPRRGLPPAPRPELLRAAVRALRAGDRASAAVRRPVPAGALPRTGSSATLTTLRAAARDGRPVWIGYVNAQGSASSRVIQPTSVEGGYVVGYDSRHEQTRTFALHRITGVAEIDADPDEAGQAGEPEVTSALDG